MTEEERIRRIEQALERYYESQREGKRRQKRYARQRYYFRTSEVELPGKYGKQKGFIFLDVDKRERKPPGIGCLGWLGKKPMWSYSAYDGLPGSNEKVKWKK